ncbi:hypothetical protein LXL04_018276 [Taraxacum kok-saghyz]
MSPECYCPLNIYNHIYFMFQALICFQTRHDAHDAPYSSSFFDVAIFLLRNLQPTRFISKRSQENPTAIDLRQHHPFPLFLSFPEYDRLLAPEIQNLALNEELPPLEDVIRTKGDGWESSVTGAGKGDDEGEGGDAVLEEEGGSVDEGNGWNLVLE